jgi:DNA-binding NarL/FixJ family response regulator
MTVKIFLVDDHHLVRQGIRLLLGTEADFEVIGEAGDGLEAVKSTLSLCPDVMIVDLMLPNLNGIEVTREVKSRMPKIKIILLSMYDLQTYVADSLQAGASAYVLKKSTADDLVHAVRQVLAGNIYLSPPLDELVLESYDRRLAEPQNIDLYNSLTERERQVFQMAAAGLNNPEIASRLALGVRTVETHRANMLKKLNIKNQTELVRYAMERNLVL